MDINYKAYTEVILYLHDAEDYYSQLENFEDADIASLNEEFFENVSVVTCNISDILRIHDNGDSRQIILRDDCHSTRYIEVIESMDEIRKVLKECSAFYNIRIRHIKFYNNNIEIS